MAKTTWRLGEVVKTYPYRNMIRQVDVLVHNDDTGLEKVKSHYTLQHFAPLECSRGYIEMVERMQQPAKVPANVE